MKATLWGTRGSLPSPGPETVRYGGNTSCIEIRANDGTLLILDAGTGIRRLGGTVSRDIQRVDILLTHLHIDHIIGLGFFDPLFFSGLEVHIWGPSSSSLDLHARLSRYLSPPLFPVRLRDLPCRLSLHDVVALRTFDIGPFTINAALVCHPGNTVGYRITADGASVCYLPDHEPALGALTFPGDPDYISGRRLAQGTDLLIHDSMYTAIEYPGHIGWGHSSLEHAMAFADIAEARRLVTFHHDPSHTDAQLDDMFLQATAGPRLSFELLRGIEGSSFEL